MVSLNTGLQSLPLIKKIKKNCDGVCGMIMLYSAAVREVLI